MSKLTLDPDGVTLDRAEEYAVAISSVYTIDMLLTLKCCKKRCYAKISRLDLATFRCEIVNSIKGRLGNTEVRRAIAMEVRKRCHPCDDGTVDVETNVSNLDLTCLSFFYNVLGVGAYAMETTIRNVWESPAYALDVTGVYCGKDTHLRAIGRITNKIRTVGEFHPVDASIMIPPNERRAHFLRSGKFGKAVVDRKTLKVHYGTAVRVHQASSFMNCECCIAMRLYAEDRRLLLNKINSVLCDIEAGKACYKRGTFVKEAAREIAETRSGAARFAQLRIDMRRTKQKAAIEDGGELGETEEEPRTVGLSIEEQQIVDGGPISTMEAEMAVLHQEFLSDQIDAVEYLKGLRVKVQGLGVLEETMKRCHYSSIRTERVLVYAAQEAAASFPEEVCALIIDGCGKERTKIPYYPERMKGVACDSDLLKCPVYGIQEAVPISFASSTTTGENAGPSDFELFNHDFIVALEWTTRSGADLYASVLLHFLFEKEMVPRVLVLVLDNAAVNKGEPIMTWLALIMMNTNIDEIHLYYPTTGHTHTTLDAHFGKAKPKDANKKILTPQGFALKRHLESLPRTRAILNFALYEVADKLSVYAVKYTNRLAQHNFTLFKHKETGEIRFKYNALLRFASPMTDRMKSLLEVHSHFMAMSDEERRNGIPVFRMDDGATIEDLKKIAASTKASPCSIPLAKVSQLVGEIPEIYAKEMGHSLVDELSDLPDIAKAEHELSLAEMLEEIKRKAGPRCADPQEDDGEGNDLIEDLMKQVKPRRRPKPDCDMAPDQAANLGKIRELEVRKVLKLLEPNHSEIVKEFCTAASSVQGYKKIIENLEGGKEAKGARKRKDPRNTSQQMPPPRNPSRASSVVSPSKSAADSTAARSGAGCTQAKRRARGVRDRVEEPEEEDEDLMSVNGGEEKSERGGSSVGSSMRESVSKYGRPRKPNTKYDF